MRRKIVADDGAAVFAVLSDIRTSLDTIRDVLGPPLRTRLRDAVDGAEDAVRFVLEGHDADPALGGAAGVNLLFALGNVLGAWHVLRQAAATQAHDPAREARGLLANVYAEQILPRATAYCEAVRAGSASIMAARDEWF